MHKLGGPMVRVKRIFSPHTFSFTNFFILSKYFRSYQWLSTRFLCYLALCLFSPLANAFDFKEPTIDYQHTHESVSKKDAIKIRAKVTDNTEVDRVEIYMRGSEDKDFAKQKIGHG